MVQLLTIHGADPDVTAVNIDGGELTARTLAQHMGHRAVVDWLDMATRLHRVHIAVCGNFEFPLCATSHVYVGAALSDTRHTTLLPMLIGCLHFDCMLRDSCLQTQPAHRRGAVGVGTWPA